MEPIYSPNSLAFYLQRPRHWLERVASEAERYYRPFLCERPGKKPRLIDRPVGPLKDIQRQIHRRLLRGLDFPDMIQGAVRNGSPERNAGFHVGKRCVITLDVADCYPSITNHMIFCVWRRRLGHSPTVARLLTRLTTAWGHLPQGAPTSSALANLVLLPVVMEVQEEAAIKGLSLSQFVDDSGVSGNFDSFDIITEMCKAFSRAGFRIGRRKIRIMRSGGRQVVTGHTVNRTVGIPNALRARVRAAVRQLEGLDVMSPDFGKTYRSTQGRVRRLCRFHPGVGFALSKRLEQVAERAGIRQPIHAESG